MNPKPVALPRPRRVEMFIADARESTEPQFEIKSMLRRREVLIYELGLLEAEIEGYAFESICGLLDDTQDVETYDGTLGVTSEFVNQYEPPVGQLQWLDDLHDRFSGPNNSPGDVAGVRWGSGGLIGNDLFLTAGHCFDQFGGGWQRPQRNGVTIEPDRIATLMQVNFNYQVNGDTGEVRPGMAFPVMKLQEYRLGRLDFAVVKLGLNEAGESASQMFGTLKTASVDIVEEDAMLCLIQHPSGRPKRIEAGRMHHNLSGQIAYDSLDTEGGSSGSPILSLAGEVVGVHTNGGCSAFSGYNYGVAIGSILRASSILR